MGGYELVHNVYFWNAIIAFGAIWDILNCVCFYWNMELYCQFMKWHLFDAWSFSGYICYPSWGNQISKYYNYSWNILFFTWINENHFESEGRNTLSVDWQIAYLFGFLTLVSDFYTVSEKKNVCLLPDRDSEMRNFLLGRRRGHLNGT